MYATHLNKNKKIFRCPILVVVGDCMCQEKWHVSWINLLATNVAKARKKYFAIRPARFLFNFKHIVFGFCIHPHTTQPSPGTAAAITYTADCIFLLIFFSSVMARQQRSAGCAAIITTKIDTSQPTHIPTTARHHIESYCTLNPHISPHRPALSRGS